MGRVSRVVMDEARGMFGGGINENVVGVLIVRFVVGVLHWGFEERCIRAVPIQLSAYM